MIALIHIHTKKIPDEIHHSAGDRPRIKGLLNDFMAAKPYLGG